MVGAPRLSKGCSKQPSRRAERQRLASPENRGNHGMIGPILRFCPQIVGNAWEQMQNMMIEVV